MTRDASLDDILARLARSRAEIRNVLEPPPPPPHEDGGDAAGAGSFPRSRTMKLIMSKRGLGTLGALAGGLLIARPALIWRLVRLLPKTALARMLVVRAVAAMRGGKA